MPYTGYSGNSRWESNSGESGFIQTISELIQICIEPQGLGIFDKWLCTLICTITWYEMAPSARMKYASDFGEPGLLLKKFFSATIVFSLKAKPNSYMPHQTLHTYINIYTPENKGGKAMTLIGYCLGIGCVDGRARCFLCLPGGLGKRSVGRCRLGYPVD